MRNRIQQIKAPKVQQIKVGPQAKKLLKPKLPAQAKGGPGGVGAFPQHPQRPPLPAGAIPPPPAGLPAPNVSYDFYISPNDSPGNAPNILNSPGHLEAEFEMATQHSQLDPNFRWTHRFYVQDGDDIRDTFPAAPANKVYIPSNGQAGDSGSSTPFLVVMVEVINRNTPQQYKRVFLKRQTPNWPTDYT